MFFVHTALVLMRSLERTDRQGVSLFTEFYTRRAFRIYPLAMVCVTIAAVIGGWPTFIYLSHLALTTNLTYTPEQCCSLWTLPIEVQMYVFLPFLFVSLRSASGIALIVTWLASIGLGIAQPFISGRLTVFAYGPCFFAGVIAWWLAGHSAFRVRASLWPIAFVTVWPIWLIASREHEMYYRWAFTLALGLAIPWFMDLKSRMLTQPAAVVAKYSYGIYLSHHAIQRWAFALPDPWPWPAMLVAAVLIPVVMYYAVEAPMIRFGREVVATYLPPVRYDLDPSPAPP
jgi:peptidoglycan/LPS O-acetylase OafA/YrhL